MNTINRNGFHLTGGRCLNSSGALSAYDGQLRGTRASHAIRRAPVNHPTLHMSKSGFNSRCRSGFYGNADCSERLVPAYLIINAFYVNSSQFQKE